MNKGFEGAIGIYTSFEKAEDAWDAFRGEQPATSWDYQIKRFKLDGPTMIYSPY